MDEKPKTVKIKWLGQRVPKIVDLPIPFLSYSDRKGQVICNPIGEFPYEDGMKLLEIAPDNFELVKENGAAQLPLCECGCGESVSKEGNRFIVGHSTRKRAEEKGADSVAEG